MRFVGRKQLVTLALAAALNASFAVVGTAGAGAESSSPPPPAAPANVSSAASGSSKTETESMHADVRRLLKLLGAGKIVVRAAIERVQPIRVSMPNIPAEFWTELYESLDPDEVVERLIPLHEKYLTHDEVRELIKFHESPVGRKLAKITPQMERDSVAVGHEWGVSLGRQVAERIKAKGYAGGGRPSQPRDKN